MSFIYWTLKVPGFLSCEDQLLSMQNSHDLAAVSHSTIAYHSTFRYTCCFQRRTRQSLYLNEPFINNEVIHLVSELFRHESDQFTSLTAVLHSEWSWFSSHSIPNHFIFFNFKYVTGMKRAVNFHVCLLAYVEVYCDRDSKLFWPSFFKSAIKCSYSNRSFQNRWKF